MTAKEFLQQAYFAQQEVDLKLEQIARLESLATRTTSTIKFAPNSSDTANSKIEKAVIEMQGQKERLADEVTELLKIMDRVSTAIAKIKNPSEKRILKYRYLCFLSWNQISVLTKMSTSNIFKLHNLALQNFSFVE